MVANTATQSHTQTQESIKLAAPGISVRRRKQIGEQLTNLSVGKIIENLKYYEMAVNQDSVINAALQILTATVVSSTSGLRHPDKEINNFVQYNLSYMEDQYDSSWQAIIADAFFTSRWAGFAVGELIFAKGSKYDLMLDGVANYHPKTIRIYPDKNGRLTDNQPTKYNVRRSGIYQISHERTEVRIPQWKCIYISNRNLFGDYYGRSDIEAIYKWWQLKEALVEMMAVALDKFGRPLTYIIAPNTVTSASEQNPATGEIEPVTTFDLLERQIENSINSDVQYLMLAQNDGSNKPSIGTIYSGNNPGDTYLKAINYCNEQMVANLTTPFFLLNNNDASTETPERRMEVFYSLTDLYKERFIQSIVRQMFSKAIKWNFSKAAALEPVRALRAYNDRAEDRVATMQMVRGMSELGYLNPKNPEDFNMVRQMVRASTRDLKEEDKLFIDNVLLGINLPQEDNEVDGSSGGGSGGTATPSRRQKPGRPVGSSSPLGSSRAKTGSKSQGPTSGKVPKVA